MRRAVIYLRVSTIEQTTADQERELREIASRMGCEIVKVYRDHGISGAKGRDRRPAFDKLCRDAARREFDMVMAWSVDRLGRSLQDLVGFLSELHALKIDLFLRQQGLDTTTPAGKAMFPLPLRAVGATGDVERRRAASAGVGPTSRHRPVTKRATISARTCCLVAGGLLGLYRAMRRSPPWARFRPVSLSFVERGKGATGRLLSDYLAIISSVETGQRDGAPSRQGCSYSADAGPPSMRSITGTGTRRSLLTLMVGICPVAAAS